MVAIHCLAYSAGRGAEGEIFGSCGVGVVWRAQRRVSIWERADSQVPVCWSLGKAVLYWRGSNTIPLFSLTSWKSHRREVLRVGDRALKPLSFLNRPQRLLCLSTGAGPILCQVGNPGEILGRGSDVTVPEAYFFLCLAPDTWIYLAVPGDRTDPELVGASFPDNLSALTERQRVSGEGLSGRGAAVSRHWFLQPLSASAFCLVRRWLLLLQAAWIMSLLKNRASIVLHNPW